MIQVPGPNGADFCIDATEVSVEQYNAWLTGNPNPANQGSECASWNTSFVPSTDATNYCNYFDYPAVVANSPKRPIRCVDWCDAAAFCGWAGKRLCGSIGSGSNAFNKPTDPDENEWFRACSQAGTRDFPYADIFNEMACIGAEYDGNPAVEPGKDYPRDVGSTASCEGGFPGLFDMSGNVEEWEGSCNGSNSKDDACLTRGGAFTHLEGDLMCASNVGTTRGTNSIIIGFRCCADFK
jgi:formylglycine-generating enzyme required for sulfatase activity